MMQINLTLIGQLITFSVFIWFTMKYVWPPIKKAMDEREKRIADGLAAADQSQRDLELAKHRSVEILQEAKLEASRIVDQANKRAVRIVEESKETARQEGERILQATQAEIAQQIAQAKRDLHNQVSELALSMAEKIVQRDIDANAHRKLLEQMVAEIS